MPEQPFQPLHRKLGAHAHQLTALISFFTVGNLENALADLGRFGAFITRLIKCRHGKEVGRADRQIGHRKAGAVANLERSGESIAA